MIARGGRSAGMFGTPGLPAGASDPKPGGGAAAPAAGDSGPAGPAGALVGWRPPVVITPRPGPGPAGTRPYSVNPPLGCGTLKCSTCTGADAPPGELSRVNFVSGA